MELVSEKFQSGEHFREWIARNISVHMNLCWINVDILFPVNQLDLFYNTLIEIYFTNVYSFLQYYFFINKAKSLVKPIQMVNMSNEINIEFDHFIMFRIKPIALYWLFQLFFNTFSLSFFIHNIYRITADRCFTPFQCLLSKKHILI